MLKKFVLSGALALAFCSSAFGAQYCTPGGVCTNGVVVEDGNGNKITTFPIQDSGGKSFSDIIAAIIANALTPPVQTRAQSVLVTDTSAQTITATGNSGALPLDSGNVLGAEVSIASVSGTSPHFRFALQESFDGGTTFKDIFHCPDMTAAATCHVPEMLFNGERRWAWTISGASPSASLTIKTTRGTGVAPLIRNFYDFTQINANTGSSTTPTWDVSGCKSGYSFQSTSGSETSAATMQLYMSADATNFIATGNTFQTGNSSNTAGSFTNAAMQFSRVVVTVAGSGVTLNYAGLYCTN